MSVPLSKFRIAKEGLWYLLGAELFGLAALFLWNWRIALFFFSAGLFFAYFFRDPERGGVYSECDILAPADGKIVEISKVYEDRYLKKEVTRISIYLSLWDVHITRSPIAGRITFIKHTPGKFHAAHLKNAPRENENNLIGIQNNSMNLLVRQIAGTLARRIVCYCKIGEAAAQGQRLGIIQFGSRVEIYLPAHIRVHVKPGTRLKAGKTIVGTLEIVQSP